MEPNVAYKAVVVKPNGKVLTLGMGPAKQIELSYEKITYGGKHGISAAKSEWGARAVIGYVLDRKVKPIPKGRLMVVRIAGRGKFFENRWRVIFKGVRLLNIA